KSTACTVTQEGDADDHESEVVPERHGEQARQRNLKHEGSQGGEAYTGKKTKS
ncbi:MAG: hypothetical protein JRF64_06495, partial [Deltaproteobacteria bacterium]|nr:hypothetical protein [Deltaproteobacteria bacterium]